MLIYTSYREKEACSALRDIARVNGRSEDIDVVAMGNKEKRYMFLWYNDPTDITRRGFGQIKVERNSVMDIFKPITLPYTLAFMFGWPMITFLRFGVNDIGGIFEDSYQTNYIRGVLEISGLLLTAVIEGFMGRRCLLLTLLTSISIAFFAISFPTLPIETKKGLFWFSNIPTTSANTLIILFTLCVYPTSLRSITIGLFTALSCIGEVVAPLAIDYAPYKLRNQDTAFFAMGFVALVGEKQIHNIFSLFTDSSQELASAITSRRCSTALCPRRWRTWSGKLRGIKSSFFLSSSSHAPSCTANPAAAALWSTTLARGILQAAPSKAFQTHHSKTSKFSIVFCPQVSTIGHRPHIVWLAPTLLFIQESLAA